MLIILAFNILIPQTSAQKNEFPKEINNYIAKTISSSQCTYEDKNERKILYSDFNNDGKDDIVFQLVIVCEIPGGGNTVCTKAYFAIFINNKNHYKLTDEIMYSGCNVNVPGSFVTIRLKSVEKNILLTEVYRYGVNDGHCCPSIKAEAKFQYLNNKLAPIEEIKDNEFVYPKIGDKTDFGDFYCVVDNVQFLQSIGNYSVSVKADGIYLLIDLTITNYTNRPINLNSGMFEIRDMDYNTYRVAQNTLPYLNLMDRKSILYEEVSPKIPKRISFLYEVTIRIIILLENS